MTKLYNDIIKLLSEDARYDYEKISTMLGEKLETIKKAVKEMERDGIIVKYTTIVNHDKIDQDIVQALIEVRVSPQKNSGFEKIADEINKFKEVQSLYLMSGGYDLAVFVEGKTLRQVATFVAERLSGIDNVLSTATHFILKKYKVEGAVLEEEIRIRNVGY